MNMKKVYRAVANKYGVSVAEVEREINAAIDVTYKNPNRTAMKISCTGGKPTPEEFIAHIIQKVRT